MLPAGPVMLAGIGNYPETSYMLVEIAWVIIRKPVAHSFPPCKY
jgi:hypothetical protein